MRGNIPLSLESLAEIDQGAVGLLMRNALVQIARDCLNRPTDKTSRTLTLELTMKPIANGPDLKHIEFVPTIKTKVPKYCTAPMVINASSNGFSYAPDEIDGVESDKD